MRDPKQILDSFRTDVSPRNMYSDQLRQFDLEEPVHRRPNRKRSSRSPLKGTAAVLSLCLATGLTAGIGTASAESELAPDHAPVDQPIHKPKVEVKQPKQDLHRGEAPPSEQSPREEFTGKPKEAEKPKVEKKQEREDIEPVSTDQPKETAHSIHAPNIPVESEHSKSPQSVEQAPVNVTPPNEASSTVPREQTKPNNQSSLDKESKGKDSAINNYSSQQPTEKASSVAEKGAPLPKSEPSNNASTQAPLLVAEAGKQVETDIDKKRTPQTVQGGELPKTAGNDLNGVLLGSGMALLGSLYALRRGKAKRS